MGLRIGVIGVLGQDAATALNPPNIAGLDVHDPKEVVSEFVQKLRPDVDLIVVLTHQGKTAPMQTDDEAHPEIHRGIDAEIELAGAVEGIDVIFSGHADAGTEEPFVHPHRANHEFRVREKVPRGGCSLGTQRTLLQSTLL